MPVGFGEIGSCPETFSPESIKDFFGYIGSWICMKRRSCAGNFVICKLCIEHAESVMMFCGENHIFHPCILCCFCPFCRIKLNRIKGCLKIFILFFILHIVRILIFCTSLHLRNRLTTIPQFPIGCMFPSA